MLDIIPGIEILVVQNMENLQQCPILSYGNDVGEQFGEGRKYENSSEKIPDFVPINKSLKAD